MANHKKTWKTAYGKEIPVSELSHQHLSNIVGYFKHVLKAKAPYCVFEELYNRFGSIQLPYHPLISYTFEIDALVRKGYTTGELNAPIHVNGMWVGSIKYD